MSVVALCDRNCHNARLQALCAAFMDPRLAMAGEIFEMRVDHIGVDGLGVGQGPEGRVSVPGVGTGDIVEVEIEHKSPHQRHAWGRVRQIIARGGDFVSPVCHHAAPIRGRCGGCPMMHLTDEAQAQAKHRFVEDALMQFPGYQRQEALQVAPDAHPHGLRYRNRAIYTAFRPNQGQIHLGSRAWGGSGFAKMAGCKVNQDVVESVAAHLTEILNERDIPLYPARSGLRYVMIRANQRGDALVELICAQKGPGWMPAVVTRLKEHPNVRGILSSVNRKGGNAFRAEAPRVVWGSESLEEKLREVSLRMNIDSFFQLNAEVAAHMYGAAAYHTGDARVIWDLYCGVGGLGIHLARAKPKSRLYGCEITESAVHLARYNAQQNGVDGFFQISNLRRGAPHKWPKPDVVAVNPPRRGLDDTVKNLLQEVRPRQIVYMSCSPASLHEDLKQICEDGYRITWHGGWDMLPQTQHVEVLVVLERSEERPTRIRRGRADSRDRTQDGPVDRAAKHRRRYARKKR